MVTAGVKRDKTYADYEALGDDVKAELIDGEIFMSPSPKFRHMRVASMLGAQLGHAFGLSDGPSGNGPGGWWILDEPECHLRFDRIVVRPDLAGWRRERMPAPPNDEHKFLISPDWVCEVFSPSTQSRDTVLKMPWYLRAGVTWAWLIDPVALRVDVYRAAGEEWEAVESVEGRVTARIQPFEELELDLGLWW